MVRTTDLEHVNYTKNVKYIDEHSYNFLKKSQVFGGEILINKIGSPGRVYQMPNLNMPVSLGMNLFMLRLSNDNHFTEEFIWAYFNSKFGKTIIKRKINGTVPLTIDKVAIKTLYIPNLSKKFQLKITDLISNSHQKLEDSKKLYKQSEQLLLKELDLLDFKPSKENIAIKSFSESFGDSGRLDSEYYQRKYDDIERNISDNSNATFIKDEFIYIKTKFDKSKDGYNYMEIGNVNVSDGTNISNYVLTQNLPANAKINVLNGDLLISTVRPNRGAITIINTDKTDLIVSGAFTVLRKKENSKINTQVLQVLLRTNTYKELLLKYNVGTQYPVIKDEDVLNLIIPIIDNKIQTQIEQKIKESFKLKEESKQLLEVAKRAVEIAIEQDEDTAMEYIQINTINIKKL